MKTLHHLMFTLIALSVYVTRTVARDILSLDCEETVYAYLHQPSVKFTATALANPPLDLFNVVWYDPSDDDDVTKQPIYRVSVENGRTPEEHILTVWVERVQENHFHLYTFEASNSIGTTTCNVTLQEKTTPPRDELLWCKVNKVIEAETDRDQDKLLQIRLSDVFQANGSSCPTPCDGQCHNVGRCSTLHAVMSGIDATGEDRGSTGVVSDQRCMTEGELSALRRAGADTTEMCIPVNATLLTTLYGDGVTSLVTPDVNVEGTLCFCENNLCNHQSFTSPVASDSGIHLPVVSAVVMGMLTLLITVFTSV